MSNNIKNLAIILWSYTAIAILMQLAIANEEKLIKYNVKFVRNIYPHLELSGEYLVKFDYSQLKSLKSVNKSKPLALLQPPLNLENRSFKYADFSRALLIRVNISNANLLESDFSKANLQGADLSNSNLKRADLSETDLLESDLSGADLQGADLSMSNLKGADLSYANLQGADLSGSILQGAFLIYTKLQGADLQQAQLQGAELTGTELQGVLFQDTELQGVASCQFIIADFITRLFMNIDHKTEIECIRVNLLNTSEKKYIIKKLNEIYSINKEKYSYIKEAIERIQKSTSAMPDLSKAKTGSYTKEEAQKWIKEYKKATGEK